MNHKELEFEIKNLKRTVWDLRIELYENRIVEHPNKSFFVNLMSRIKTEDMRTEIDAIKDYLQIQYEPATREGKMVKKDISDQEVETVVSNWTNRTCAICKDYSSHLPDCPNLKK